MSKVTSRLLVAVVAALLVLPIVGISSARTASAQTTDGAIIGVSPGWNLDSNDATLGPDIGTFDSCAGGATPGYVKDMNDWQGKHNTVINFYDGFDSTSTGNIFGYSNPCNNSQFVPWIWNNYDAIPMQTGEMSPPEGESSCADGTPNPYACFDDSNSTAVTDNGYLKTFGQTLNRWLNGTDAFGQQAPPGGRRYYIRFNWESNGTWVPWGPAYLSYPATSGTQAPLVQPVFADDCADLFNAEMFNVAWWRYVRDTVDSYITPPSGETVSQEVNWNYSQYAYSPLTAANSLGQPYFSSSVQNCPAQTNTVYSTSQLVYPSDLVEAMYPGDDVTDWTGLDGYGTCSATNQTIPSPSTVFGSYVNDLHSFTTKPVSIDEVGVSIRNEGVLCSNPQTKTTWINDYMNFAQNNGIKMSVYFNDDENSADGGVDDDAVFCSLGTDSECTTDESTQNTYIGSETGIPTVYGVYHAYQQGLQSSWWESPDPNQNTTTGGRVMDDATFQGTW
jgi:hypothetical protein